MDNGPETKFQNLFRSEINPSEEGRENMYCDNMFFSNRDSSNYVGNQYVNNITFAEYVERVIRCAAPAPIERTVLRSFLEVYRFMPCDMSDQGALNVWVAMLLRKGVKYHTLRRYLSVIKEYVGKYAVFIGLPDTIEFPDARTMVETHGVGTEDKARRRKNLGVFRNIVGCRCFPEGEKEPWNIFLYLFYSCSSSFVEAIRLRYEDVSEDDRYVTEILESVRTYAQRRYVFPLGQGKKREPQILREITGRMGVMLRGLGIDTGPVFDIDLIRSMWVDAAFESGVSAVEIRSVLDSVPSEDSYLNLLPFRPLSESVRKDVLRKVAEYIHPHDEQWHVMRLRHAVTPDDIKERTQSRMPRLSSRLILYYPTREVIVKEKKRIIKRELPYIPGLLFFKIGENHVVPLFREIGDLAWGYKDKHGAGARYAVIPKSEMERFQLYVGKFTSDVEMELTDREPLAIGRRVRITGGLMEGYEGEIYDISDAKEGSGPRRLFQLNISSDQALRWTVDVEDIYIEPID